MAPPQAKFINGVSTLYTKRSSLVAIAMFCVVLLLYYFRIQKPCLKDPVPPHYVRDQNTKFWCYDDQLPWGEQEMIEKVHEFAALYDTRPLGRKIGGMGFDHSFYLWFTLKKLQPSFIVESGIFEGHTTWLIKQACPEAHVISIDPRNSFPQVFDGVTYFTGDNFSDFNAIPWGSYDFSPENSFVLFDDHMSGMRRAMEAYSHGFGHVMFDDNFFGTGGDNYSLRKICDLRFQVPYKDSFGTVTKELSEETRKAHSRMMRHLIKGYYEFPPMLSTKISGCTLFEDDEAKPALLQADTDVSRILRKVPIQFLQEYYYICYIRLNNH